MWEDFAKLNPQQLIHRRYSKQRLQKKIKIFFADNFLKIDNSELEN